MRAARNARLAGILAASFLVTGPAVAQELTTALVDGRKYAAGARLSSARYGVSLVVPAGHEAVYGEDADAGALVVGAPDAEGAGLAILRTGQSIAQLTAILNERQTLDQDTVLEPAGAARAQGSRVTARYLNDELVGRAIGLLGPNGTSVLLMYFGPRASEQRYASLLEQLAASVRFSTPAAGRPPSGQAAPARPAESGLTRAWTELLSGMMLRFLSSSGDSSGGTSASRTLHLCSDGSFGYRGSSLVTADVPGVSGFAGDRDQATGRWRLESPTQTTVVLVLAVDGGGTQRVQVGYDGSRTFVDGERWFRVASDACR